MSARVVTRLLSIALVGAFMLSVAGCPRQQRAPERGGQQGGGGGQQGGGQQRQDQPQAPNPNVAEGIRGMFGEGTSAIALGNSVLVALPAAGAPAGTARGAGSAPAPAAGDRGFTGPGDVGLRIRGQYPFLSYVYHVTEPATAARVSAIAADLQQGRPIAPHLAELNRIIQAATPLPVGGAAPGTGGAGGAGAPAGGEGR